MRVRRENPAKSLENFSNSRRKFTAASMSTTQSCVQDTKRTTVRERNEDNYRLNVGEAKKRASGC